MPAEGDRLTCGVRRLDPDVVAGTLLLVLCLATAAPVLVLQRSGADPTTGPAWLWWTAFGGYVVALTVCTWLVDVLPRPRVVLALAAQAVLGPAVVLLAPQAGWTPILLVFTAATSAYVVGRLVSVALVAINTVVIAVATVLAQGPGPAVPFSAGLYLLLQSLSLLAVVSQQRTVAFGQALARAHVELRATSVLLEASTREAERLRIARDLHDVVGHQLTALALELEVATHRPGPEHVVRARAIARDLLGDVRSTVGRLREPPPAGLRDAFEEVVRDLPHPIVHLSVGHEAEHGVDDATRTVLVRCLQEVVTNTIRHSGADNLWVTVDRADGAIRLLAGDDGRGSARLRLGNGLTGMTERLAGVGGRVDFDHRSGFRVRVQVPSS